MESFSLNTFTLDKRLDELDVSAYVYTIENLKVSEEDRYRVLNGIANRVGRELRGIAITHAPTDNFNGIILFNPARFEEEIELDNLKIKFHEEIKSPKTLGPKIKKFFYELIRAKLEYHGFWGITYNRYYRLTEDILENKFRIFRGIFFRIDVLSDGSINLTLDPITRVASYDNLHEIASRWGYEKAKKLLKNRYAIALIVRKNSLCRALYKITNFRPDLSAGESKVIDIGGEKYTIREYYITYRKMPEIVKYISDNAPLLEIIPPGSKKPIYLASSLAHLNLRTSDLTRGEKKLLESEIYLTPARRMILTKSFLTSLNPLQHPFYSELGTFKFRETPLTFRKNRNANILPPLLLKFKKRKITITLDNYVNYFKNSIRKFGVAKDIALPQGLKIAIVYPENYMTDNEARNFYDDVRHIALKYFKKKLPKYHFLWGYRDDASLVIRNYERFKNKVLAILGILRSKDDDLYFLFKDAFKDKPSQMATIKLVRSKEKLEKKDIHKYWNAIINLVSGLLGKLGLRPWLLGDKLDADFYIGLDVAPNKVAVFTLMDRFGNYLGETWITVDRLKVSENDVSESLQRLLVKYALASKNGKKLSLVFMKDGDVYQSERAGILNFIDKIKDKEILYAIVSVKKNVPYRIYKLINQREEFPDIGSYIILDNKYAILASTGHPILKRLAKPILIEYITSGTKEWYSVKKAIKDVYALSYMHWASLTQKIKLPAPIKYADDFSTYTSRGIHFTGPPL